VAATTSPATPLPTGTRAKAQAKLATATAAPTPTAAAVLTTAPLASLTTAPTPAPAAKLQAAVKGTVEAYALPNGQTAKAIIGRPAPGRATPAALSPRPSATAGMQLSSNMRRATSSSSDLRGTATWVAPQLIRIDGTGVGRTQFRRPVTISLGDPIGSPSAGVETNPFSLFIGTSGTPGVDQMFSVASAIEVGAPSGGSVLLQYWDYQVTSDSTFEGTLADTHYREAAVMNLVGVQTEIAPNLNQPFPIAMQEGMRIQGQLAGNQLRIRLSGSIGNGAPIPFEAEVVADVGQ
jgi:hypothetical protein